jgi:uncharacterized protein YdeI (YjbR/CyaY-like superfamily)
MPHKPLAIDKDRPCVYAASEAEWRQWLKRNHDKQKSIWLIQYKKDTGVPSISYATAVEQALCFGWIDSKANKRDDNSFYLSFARRNPKSKWSQLNKTRVEKLIGQKKMTAAGMKMVDLAKASGTWDALNEVEALTIPDDLKAAFEKNKSALKNFEAFPASTKRGILEWISNAKKPETRALRIMDTVSKAAENIRANQYVKKT